MSKKKKHRSSIPKSHKSKKYRPKKPFHSRQSRQISSHLTIKCPLRSILRNSDHLLPLFDDLVIDCNDIVTETYQFIRLFCLHKYHSNQPLPDLADKSNKFILYSIRTVTSKSNERGKSNDEKLDLELEAFYQSHFKPLLSHLDKLSRFNMIQIINYLAIDIRTAILNNLKEHFITRLLRFINVTAHEYDHLPDKKASKARSPLKKAIFNNDPELVPDMYKEWYTKYRDHILPEKWKSKTLSYDVKANPMKYLPYSFYMNEVLESFGVRLFQSLSLRTSNIPAYITLDTVALVQYFINEENSDIMKTKLLKDLKKISNKRKMWNLFFNLDLPIFHQNRYDFNFTLQTDGIGASLLFTNKNYKKFRSKSDSSGFTKQAVSVPYVHTLSDQELDDLKSYHIVGADPGKFNLLYLADNNRKTLRYSALQRRTETLSKRNARIMKTEKTKHNIVEKEIELSSYNSNTVNFDKFKDYIEAINAFHFDPSVRKFYHDEKFRNMKLRHYIYTRKSEDKFLQRIEDTFGPPDKILIAYGDWSRTSQMKGFMPTKGVGLRTLVAKRFKTVGVQEFRTSMLHEKCHEKLKNMKIEDENSKCKKIYRCLVCNECESSESKNRIFVTRDLNSALNIRNLAEEWIFNKIRPSAFLREAGSGHHCDQAGKGGQ